MFEHIRSMLKEAEIVSCNLNFLFVCFVFPLNSIFFCKEFQQRYQREQTLTLQVRTYEEQIGLLKKRISDLTKGS
jgi:hypothetical protein